MSEHKNIDELFDAARNSNVNVSKDQVKALIAGTTLAAATAAGTTTAVATAKTTAGMATVFTLKTTIIVMTTTAITAAAVITAVTLNSEPAPPAETNSIPPSAIIAMPEIPETPEAASEAPLYIDDFSTPIPPIENVEEPVAEEPAHHTPERNSAGCFTYFYPIKMKQADGTIVEIADEKAMAKAKKEWGTKGEKPRLVFPIKIQWPNEPPMDVESQEALDKVYARCKGRYARRKACFVMLYPVKYQLPNGQIMTVGSISEHKTAGGEWRKEGVKAKLQYPVKVQWEGHEPVEVASEKEMRAMKEKCIAASQRQRSRKLCFETNYPLQYLLPNGKIVTIESAVEHKTTAKAWHEEGMKPELQYPVTIQWEGHEPMEVKDADEMRAMKDKCAALQENRARKRRTSFEEYFKKYGVDDLTSIKTQLTDNGIAESQMEKVLGCMTKMMYQMQEEGDDYEMHPKLMEYLLDIELSKEQITLVEGLARRLALSPKP